MQGATAIDLPTAGAVGLWAVRPDRYCHRSRPHGAFRRHHAVGPD
jgi:hypothetical protein